MKAEHFIRWAYALIGCVFTSVYFACLWPEDKTCPDDTRDTTELPSQERDTTLSAESVYQHCIDNGVAYPAIVTAQSIQEFGWNYESHNAQNRHNILGLGGDSAIVFDRWQDGVDYYRDRIQSRYTGGDYYEFLIRINYASDTAYCNKVRSIVQRLND